MLNSDTIRHIQAVCPGSIQLATQQFHPNIPVTDSGNLKIQSWTKPQRKCFLCSSP